MKDDMEDDMEDDMKHYDFLRRLDDGLATGLFGLLLIGSLISCGGHKSTKDGCDKASSSSRVDTTKLNCTTPSGGEWTDSRLAEADDACVSYMSATDAYGLPRLISFCGCLSESMAKKIDYIDFQYTQETAIIESYERSGVSCSVSREYAIPSPAAGSVMDNDGFKDFMTTCRETTSTPKACRCLIRKNAAKFISKFAFSEDVDIHACGVLRAEK